METSDPWKNVKKHRISFIHFISFIIYAPALFNLLINKKFSRDCKEQPWGANADNSELRQHVWMFSERWTRLAERMTEMKKEVELRI